MISPWLVYFIFSLDSLVGFFAVVSGFFIIAFIFYTMWLSQEDAHDSPNANRMKLSLTLIGLISLFLACVIPSTKTAIAIYLIPKVVNSEKAHQIPFEIQKYLAKYLEEDS